MISEAEREKESTTIAHGEVIERFLADEAVKAAFARVDAQYVEAFRKSTTSAERDQIHARIVALTDLQTELATAVGNGRFERNNRERREGRRQGR